MGVFRRVIRDLPTFSLMDKQTTNWSVFHIFIYACCDATANYQMDGQTNRMDKPVELFLLLHLLLVFN